MSSASSGARALSASMSASVSASKSPNTAAANQLQDAVAGAPLSIRENVARLAAFQIDSRASLDENNQTISSNASVETYSDPASLAADLASQITFLRKLKFQYLEQHAKDKYIKTIVSDIDDTPFITAGTNEELRSANEAKKEKLRETKARLKERQGDLQTLAPLVEQDLRKAESFAQEAAELSQKILDARLALSRIRTAHPGPRLTVSSALATLDEQVNEMQTLDEQLGETNVKLTRARERSRALGTEVERLRTERAKIEKEAEKIRSESREDGKVMRLYEWYISALKLHKLTLNILSWHEESENELRIVYTVQTDTGKQRQVEIVLVFYPNTRNLAEADVRMPGGGILDLGDIIVSAIQANDVSVLVAAALFRARTT